MRKTTLCGAISTILISSSLTVTTALAQPLPGGTLDPTTIPKYVQPLVIPPVMKDTGTANDYDIAVRQFQQQILPGGIWNTVTGRADPFPATTVWSYGPAADTPPAVAPVPAATSQFNYPAFTVENTVNTPTTVDWINDLKDPATGRFLPHLLPIDQTLHWANPSAECIDGIPRTDCRGMSAQPYKGPVPIVTHVHGAHVGPESDGYPEAWWLPDPTGSNFSCVTDPAQAKDSKYVCQGSLANGYGLAPNTNATPGVGNFTYPNDQPSTTLWYHDHSLGMTRNNVYAGPAGYWLIREPGGGETGLVSGTLPGPAPVAGDDPNFDPAVRAAIREIPVVIQDRSFNADGSLFYPDNRAFFEGVPESQLNVRFLPNKGSDISPIWNPEAFFNTMVVNGTTWPVLDVEPERYRLRLLNGCNSRFLNVALKIVNQDGTLGADVPMYMIGAEQSLLPQVVKIETGLKTALPGDGTEPADGAGDAAADPQEALLMGLAERADVIVDFSGLAPGTTIRMINTAPDAPFGGFPDVPADPSTSGQVMQFVVMADNPDTPPDNSTPAASLQLGPVDEAEAGLPSSVTRDLALLEEESTSICVQVKPNGQIAQIGKVKGGGANFLTDCAAAGGVPFAPKAAVLGDGGAAGGTVTLWSDPIVTNPALGATETWELWNWSADAHPIHLHLVKFQVQDRQVIGGPVRTPEATEAGWKDTVIAYPGEVTRVKATFDLPGLYVWHCHIVEHEDNEMMVPYCVGDPGANGCAGL
jgi:spore coat protein A